MNSVEFKHVSKIYTEEDVFKHQIFAAKDLNFQIEAGEFVVLVGPSGCGKSTILRMLAGLESPDEGDILINGKTVLNDLPQQRNIAMVFQNYALYPHMTVEQNLSFPLKMRKVSKQLINKKVTEIAEILSLTDLLKRKPKQISGGQRQRVAMGRALVRDPALLLMDEPLSNLDAKLRVQIRGEIAALQKRMGVTTIYVTHDQSEAMTMGHRVVVLNSGILMQMDTPRALYEDPKNRFVAEFIGSPGMNIFPVRIQKHHDQLILNIDQQKLIFHISESEQIANLPDRFIEDELYMGIRPENLIPSTHTNKGNSLSAKLISVEILGHESLVYFRLSEQECSYAMRIQTNDNFKPMTPLNLKFGLAKACLFTHSGERII